MNSDGMGHGESTLIEKRKMGHGEPTLLKLRLSSIYITQLPLIPFILSLICAQKFLMHKMVAHLCIREKLLLINMAP